MNPKNIDNVIKELTKAEHAYYVLNSPIMSDGEYDKLFNELKQYEMSLKFPQEKYNFMRFFLGDIRDRDRLYKAFAGVDYVVHAAALKNVPILAATKNFL